MNYFDVSNLMASQKSELGYSEAYIAKLSGVSQPTVHRILSGAHNRAAYEDVVKIAHVLQLYISVAGEDPEDIIERRAQELAEEITRMTLATSQLEGQGFSEKEQRKFIHETKIKLLAGSRRKLWDKA